MYLADNYINLAEAPNDTYCKVSTQKLLITTSASYAQLQKNMLNHKVGRKALKPNSKALELTSLHCLSCDVFFEFNIVSHIRLNQILRLNQIY